MVKAVRRRDVEKFLRKSGWTIIRQTGRHDVWGSPDGKETFPLPRHDMTSPGVVRQVINTFPDTPRNWR